MYVKPAFMFLTSFLVTSLCKQVNNFSIRVWWSFDWFPDVRIVFRNYALPSKYV